MSDSILSNDKNIIEDNLEDISTYSYRHKSINVPLPQDVNCDEDKKEKGGKDDS